MERRGKDQFVPGKILGWAREIDGDIAAVKRAVIHQYVFPEIEVLVELLGLLEGPLVIVAVENAGFRHDFGPLQNWTQQFHLLANLADAVRRTSRAAGSFRVISLSFNAEDTPETAASIRPNYTQLLAKDFPEDGWVFLTGDDDNIRKGIGSDSRIGPAFLFSGVGYGGSCFPKDVKAILKFAKDKGYDFKILDAVEQVNARQKQVLALVLESGLAGPSLVAKELGVGVSTAYRDLASLEELGLITSDGGKRTLTDDGLRFLGDLTNRSATASSWKA